MKRLVVFMVALVLVVMVVPSAAAPRPFESPISPGQPELPDTSPISDYVSAVGVGALIMLAVQIVKAVGLVPDGQAGVWATTANVVTFAALWVAGVFGFDVTGAGVQDVLRILEQVGKLILMIATSPTFFEVLRNAKVLGQKPQ